MAKKKPKTEVFHGGMEKEIEDLPKNEVVYSIPPGEDYEPDVEPIKADEPESRDFSQTHKGGFDMAKKEEEKTERFQIDLTKLHDLLEEGKTFDEIKEEIGVKSPNSLKLAIFKVSQMYNKLYAPEGMDKRQQKGNIVEIRKNGILISRGKVHGFPIGTKFKVEPKPDQEQIILTQIDTEIEE